jgi:ribosomal protein S12 methylthiotransferase accessory factor YcaO
MLDDLRRRYPLPASWEPPEPFFETLALGESVLHLAGLATASLRGERPTGSAASASDPNEATARAYFELVERTALLDAAAEAPRELDLLDRRQRRIGRIAGAEAFPISPAPERWRPSRSNGVAAHGTWEAACDGAWAELVERDRVLRSWYGELAFAPAAASLQAGAVPPGLAPLTTWSARVLPAAPGVLGDDLTVAVVAGFPKSDDVPLTIGFGAARNAEGATRAAAAEAVQRLGFLLGESIPETAPEPSPTPDYHQEFFLHAGAHPLLRAWLDEVGETPPRACASFAPDRDTGFVDVTPPALRGRLWVAKAVCARAEPLVFGEPPPHRAGVRGDRKVHPIA